MKLLFIAPGNSIHSYRWVKYFADRGHEVHWHSMYALGYPLPEGVQYYESDLQWICPLNYFRAFVYMRGLLKRVKPDILHIHSLGAYGLGAFCGFHPIVATAWGSDVLMAGHQYGRRVFVRQVLLKADCITCDADHMIGEVKLLAAEAGRIERVNFGIDTKTFCPKDGRARIRDMLGVGTDPVVISLRSLQPIYDVQSLVRAIPLVLSQVPNAKFLIAGDGVDEEMLKKLAKSLNLLRHILFLGKVNNSDLPDYLNAADVYVSTALSDAGIAASTAEAMACGLPAVVTDSGENKQWIDEGVSGFVVPVKSPEALSQRIVHLLNDERRRRSFGKAGRKTIEERNDYWREMEKMERIYREVAS